MPVNRNEIIQYVLKSNRPVHANEIADAFRISSRYVKKMIACINNDLISDNLQICSDTHKGYWIEQNEKPLFFSILRSYSDSLIPSDQSQRVIYLSLYMLAHRNRLSGLQTMANLLYVSKATIAADMKYIQEICMTAGDIKIKPLKKGGYELEASEAELRRFFCVLVSIFDHTEKEYLKHCVIRMFSAVHIATQLHEQLIHDFYHHRINVNDFSLRMLTYYLLFAAYRMKDGFPIEFEITEQSIPWIGDTEKCLSMEFDEKEKGFIIHFIKKKMIRFTDYDNSAPAYEIIRKFQSAILDRYHFDILTVPDTQKMLGSFLSFDLLADSGIIPERLRKDHPFAWSLACELDRIITENIGTNLSDDNLERLTASFAVLLNRHSKKLRTVVLSELESGHKDYLLYRLDSRFAFYLDIKGIYPLYSINNKDFFNDVDFIICTTRQLVKTSTYQRMAKIINKEILYINPLFEHQDRRVIEHYIHDSMPSRSGDLSRLKNK